MAQPEILLRTMAAALDGLDVALCAFDDEDRTLLWNRAFLRYFPEHAAHVHAGEPYRDNLRRFYESRLGPEEMVSIDRYIEEGIARHRNQQRPYAFRHRGAWLQVSSQALPGVGRVRVWSRAGPPRLSDTEERTTLPAASPVTDNTEIFEHVGDGVVLTDADNRITWVNEHIVGMFALADKTAVVGTPFEDAYRAAWAPHPDDEASTYARGLSTLTDNLRFAGAPFELPLPGKRWVRVIEQRRRDGVGFFALVDITMLKRQQQELIDAERRARANEALLAQKTRLLEATLARMEQGVMMVNSERIVEVCNRRAIELLELPLELMASKPSFAQLLEFQWATHEFAQAPLELQQLFRNGGDLERPQFYDRIRPNGRVIEVQSMPIQGGAVLLTYSDITERKRAEATRRVLESQLRESQKLEAIGTLAGGIAHDFNNIMAAILGNVAFAKEALHHAHEARLYLEQIDRAGRRARSLVQQILAFSEKQSVEFSTLWIRPLVEEAVMMLRSTVGPAVALSTQLADEPMVVRGHPTQIQQVLMNLGINAWQALLGGAGHIEIGLEAQALPDPAQAAGLARITPGHYVHLWVRDDGCGMDEATRERIFEPFFTTKPVGQGTGLGLAVAHGIIEAHGGGIAIQSAPGRGSTFHLYLPRVEGEAVALPRELAFAATVRGQGQHVLYVDDDEAMATMVEALLRRLGYRATCTQDAQAAVALVAGDPMGVDVVVTDFNMPGLSGLDVVRALARIRPALPVAITSGYISDELRASAAELRVAGVMQKEHTLEQLGALVHAALSRPAAARLAE